jgi:RimJ/RimL family protein N-acetyltransferase
MDPLIDSGRGNASSPVLTTARLRLHTWSDEDAESLYRLSTDPEVMRFFPSMPTREQVFGLVERHRENLATGRPGLFAVSLIEPDDAGVSTSSTSGPTELIGFVGLATPSFDAPFMPCVEIGWRLAKRAWGRGYATEAGQAVLAHGFDTLGVPEVVSFTAVLNEPSIAVMRRLGMHRDPAEDFDHPRVPEGHPVRRHVLYRLRADEWGAH